MVDINKLQKAAQKFADDWKDASYERGETQTFYNDLFAIFGKDRRDYARYEKRARRINKNDGFIDLLWPGVLLVEQKSRGKDLGEAYVQADEYFEGLEENERPRYILTCDFQKWELHDLDENEDYAFDLKDLPKHIHLFNFMQKGEYVPPPADPVSIKASEKMAKLYDALKDGRYDKKNMEYLLTRLTFCMFADYVGIFNPGDFRKYLNADMQPGAAEVGGKLVELFDVLDTPEDERQVALREGLEAFRYINGGLFNETIKIPSFNNYSRNLLREAADEDWSKVSPAIFGALFQNIMDADERRSSGSHYTPEENIMKVIRPLFLDELEAEFESIQAKPNNKRALENFQSKLSGLTFFDPACGAGNFLIIAYREIRRLETRTLSELYGKQKTFSTHELSKIDVDQFYGIEINKFSASIAQTSLWMMDHMMNLELGDALEDTFTRIPIEKSPNIICADALEMDWETLLEPNDCSYILGNPPFAGGNNMGRDRLATTMQITGSGVLDYVCNWFVKAAEYASDFTGIGFVATNSIVQGEQTQMLWNALKRHNVHIKFAYTPFKWDSDTTGKAHVHVVIIGLFKGNKNEKKYLFHGDMEENPNYISPYLDGTTHETVTVASASRPINGLPKIKTGTEPRDGKNYIFDETRMKAFLKDEPLAVKHMYPYIGGKDHISGDKRWILSLHDADPSEVRAMPHVMNIVKKVQDFRARSKNEPTRILPPRQFYITLIPKAPFLVIPETTSDTRDYIPIGYAEPPAIPSKATKIIENADLGLFGLLTSNMHMVWLRNVGGRLKSDLRYSINIVYNTFPVPNEPLDVLEPYAQAVLDARAKYPDSTLADLYDSNAMPPDLRKAHRVLDRKVDRMYRKGGFGNDDERFEFLLEEYGKMTK